MILIFLKRSFSLGGLRVSVGIVNKITQLLTNVNTFVNISQSL